MAKRQLIIVYAVVIFMMVWGLDIINLIKVNRAISVDDIIQPFALSQIIYVTTTLLLTRWIFKKFYASNRYGMLAISLLSLAAFFIVIRYLLEEVLFYYAFGFSNYSKNVSIHYYALDNVYYALIYMVLGTLIFLLDNQMHNQKKQALLLQKTNEAELQFLRSQINPHFLFNTLNNIYALVYEKSDKAPDAVLKLAELMRYLLYEEKQQVPLKREWKYVENFISLQKLRFDESIPVKVQVKGSIDHYNIIPHLLICFVENGFKHADFKDSSQPLKICLECNGRSVHFTMENKIGKNNKDTIGGIGLENIRRRLELSYPNSHVLKINSTDNYYTSALTLNF